MKKVSLFIRTMFTVAILCLFPAFAIAEGESPDVYMSGNSNTAAGAYVIQSTNTVFHYQGMQYAVYDVVYDNTEMNMKIAVNMRGDCNSFVAYSDDCMLFYNCSKDGFGVRKVMFSNPWAAEKYDAQKFHDQSIILKQKKIEKKQAMGLIASYVPRLRG